VAGCEAHGCGYPQSEGGALMDQYRFSAGSMEAFTRDLKDASLRIRAETDKTVEVTGGMIRDEAIEQAKKHSTSIPPTIKMDPGPGAVIIHAGSTSVPLAVLYEKGNKNGKSGSDSKRTLVNYGATGMNRHLAFGHPVFGQGWTWQKRFPFLAPARTKVRASAVKLMDAAWDKALEPLRLR
jgi:hypothetical protein